MLAVFLKSHWKLGVSIFIITCDQQEAVCYSQDATEKLYKTQMVAGHPSYRCNPTTSPFCRRQKTPSPNLEKQRIWNSPIPHHCSCQPRLLVWFRLLMQMFNISEWKQLSPTHTKIQQKAIIHKTSSGKKNNMPSWPIVSPISYAIVFL